MLRGARKFQMKKEVDKSSTWKAYKQSWVVLKRRKSAELCPTPAEEGGARVKEMYRGWSISPTADNLLLMRLQIFTHIHRSCWVNLALRPNGKEEILCHGRFHRLKQFHRERSGRSHVTCPWAIPQRDREGPGQSPLWAQHSSRTRGFQKQVTKETGGVCWIV